MKGECINGVHIVKGNVKLKVEIPMVCRLIPIE
jgi:hypothetical protein